MNIVEAERQKYTEMWQVPDYKIFSPGLENVSRFMDIMKPAEWSMLIDIGCGAGVAGLEFQNKHGLDVTWMDITDAGLEKEVPRKRFIQQPIWDDWSSWKHGFDYGFCCDVMEHIPTEYVMLTFDRIISHCRTSWFQIALLPETYGEAIGKTLHLTVKPYNWWLERLRTISDVIDARDLCGVALYVVRAR